MDLLKDSIKPQIIPLSAQDALFSFVNHPLVHFFANPNKSLDFMPSSVLQKSLYLALCDFPILVGHIQDAKRGGLAEIVVDPDRLNMPEFLESTSSTVSFESIRDDRFGWDIWPEGVATAGVLTYPDKHGIVKLVKIHVVRLQDNSGLVLFCNIPHYVLDGFGYYAFMNRWATVCRERRQNNDSLSNSPTYVFDRQFSDMCGLNNQLHTNPLPKPIIDMFTTSTVGSKMMAWLPYNTRLYFAALVAKVDYGVAHIYHVSSSLFSKICSNLGLNQLDVSTYSVVTSIFSIATLAALTQANNNRRFIGSLPHIFKSRIATQYTILNMRHTHSLLSSTYIGNHVVLYPVCFTASDLDQHQNELMAKLVLQISQGMEGIDTEFASKFAQTLQDHPNAFAKYSLDMSATDTCISVIDERQYEARSVNFGEGSPVLVNGIPKSIPNFIALLPSLDSDGGINVYVSLRPSAAECLRQNSWLQQFATFLF